MGYFTNFIVVLGLGIGVPTQAASAEASLTFEGLLEKALQKSPIVQEIEALVSSERSEGIRLATKQNPVLDAEYRLPSSDRGEKGSDEFTLTLSQSLRPTDFGERSRINLLLQKAADSDRALQLLRFSQNLKLAYAKVWILEQRQNELVRYADCILRIERAVKNALKGGLLSSGEVLLFQAEAKKIKIQQAAIGGDLLRARAVLSHEAGFPVTMTLGVPPPVRVPPEEDFLASRFQLPLAKRAELAAAIAREQRSMAELDAYPKFAPRLVYERNSDFSDYVGIGVSIDLPLFDTNQHERVKRQADVQQTEASRGYLAGEGFATEIRALRTSLDISATQVRGYEQEVIPKVQQALTLEEKLLTSGQGSIFRVWQVFRELSALEAEVLERRVKLFSERAELVLLTGLDF